MLFAGLGRSVLGKTVPSVLTTALGMRPRAVLKTSGTIFPNTDLPAVYFAVCIFVRILVFKFISQPQKNGRKTAINLVPRMPDEEKTFSGFLVLDLRI